MSKPTESNHKRDAIALDPPPRMVRPIRRRPWMIGGLLVFAIALVAALGTRAAPMVVKPGDLSNAHAQILRGTLTQERCTACHVNVSTQAWSQLSETGHAGTVIETATMTDRCLQCHHNRIAPSRARSAHNLSPEDRLHLTNGWHRPPPNSDQALGPTPVKTASSRASSDDAGWFAWLASARVTSAAISQDDVACSVCHREHHGAHANLSAVTDARCQSCHTRQFGSFASSHPEFNDYPATSARTIAFDHVRHANLHFPQQSESEMGRGADSAGIGFDCRACHIFDGSDGRDLGLSLDPIVSTLPFEVACASCHDEKLKVATASGPALIALPILPNEVTRQVASWPEAATGSPDGELSAWMKLLLTAQEPTLDLEGLDHLGRVDWQSPVRQKQAVRLASAIRQFAIDLAIHGQPRLRELAIKAGASEAEAEILARSFQPQLMRDAVQDWFGNKPTKADRFSSRFPDRFLGRERAKMSIRLVGADDWLLDEPLGDSLANDPLLDSSGAGASELGASELGASELGASELGGSELGGNDLLGNDLLQNWDAASDPLAAPIGGDLSRGWQDMIAERFDPATTQTFGGWYRDDLTLSLRYRGTGHTDGVLRTLIELAQSRDPELLEQNAVASCRECHTSGRWKSQGITGLRDRLTKFTHRPHLDIRGLQDCRHCHEMNSPASINVVDRVLADPISDSFDGGLGDRAAEVLPVASRATSPTHPGGDFLPLQKASCAACHTSAAAGDHCTMCHRYHVGDVP